MDNAAPTWRPEEGEYLAWRNGVFTIRGKEPARSWRGTTRTGPIDVSAISFPRTWWPLPVHQVRLPHRLGRAPVRRRRREASRSFSTMKPRTARSMPTLSPLLRTSKLLVDSRATTSRPPSTATSLSAGAQDARRRAAPTRSRKDQGRDRGQLQPIAPRCRFWARSTSFSTAVQRRARKRSARRTRSCCRRWTWAARLRPSSRTATPSTR